MDEKTLFDGRLHFHKRLNDCWSAYHNFNLIQNVDGCVSALNSILIECAGLINEEKELMYKKELDRINNKNQLSFGGKVNPNTINKYVILKDLRDLSIRLRKDTKKLYLPIEELRTEWDSDAFFEGN